MPGSGMAFYGELPLGTDHEVQYSPYRVSNLAVALELVRLGGKQGKVVDLITQIQGDLSLAFDGDNSTRPTSERTNVLAINHSVRTALQAKSVKTCKSILPCGVSR